MNIDRKDPRLSTIVDDHAEVQLIADNFGFTEGPIWHPREKHLTFSDIPKNRLYRWRPGAGAVIYREPSHMANGNTFDALGRILTCEHATSRVVREENGRLTVLASHYERQELNSPNDIIVAHDGSIWFTDPTYGRQPGHGLERPMQLDFRGVYRIAPGSNALSLLAKDFEQPNGLCFDLTQQHLYVADTARRQIRKFKIEADGSLSGGGVFAESPAPDGLKIDSLGNIYTGGPRGLYVYDRNDGGFLGIIGTPKFCANFTWGDDDNKTLFLTASNALWRMRVKIPGAPLF